MERSLGDLKNSTFHLLLIVIMYVLFYVLVMSIIITKDTNK